MIPATPAPGRPSGEASSDLGPCFFEHRLFAGVLPLHESFDDPAPATSRGRPSCDTRCRPAIKAPNSLSERYCNSSIVNPLADTTKTGEQDAALEAAEIRALHRYRHAVAPRIAADQQRRPAARTGVKGFLTRSMHQVQPLAGLLALEAKNTAERYEPATPVPRHGPRARTR